MGAMQTVFAAACLLLRAQAVHGAPCWIFFALALPCLLYLVSPSCRRRLLGWLSELWNTLESYPVRTTRLPWRATLVFVVAPAVVLMLNQEFAISGGDSAPVMMTASRLTTAGNFDLTDYVKTYVARGLFTQGDGLPYYFRREATGVYSAYPSGMVLFALPTAATAHLLGGFARPRCSVAAGTLDGGLGFGRLVGPILPPRLALGAAETRPGDHSPLGGRLGDVLNHRASALAARRRLVLELDGVTRRIPPNQPRLPGGAVLQGVAFAMMAACRLTSILFIAPFGIWVLCRSPRQAFGMAGFAGLAYLPWAWLYGALYGSPFGPSTMQAAAANWSDGGHVKRGGRRTHKPLARVPGLSTLASFRRPRPCPGGSQRNRTGESRARSAWVGGVYGMLLCAASFLD